jgi:hypothetical protein
VEALGSVGDLFFGINASYFEDDGNLIIMLHKLQFLLKKFTSCTYNYFF